MNYKIETTIKTLGSYQTLACNNRKKNSHLLAVRTEKNGAEKEEFLTKIKRSDVTCWNLFLRIFNRGKLAHVHISIKSIEKHLVQVFESSNFTDDYKMDCDSQAYKTVCKIRDWAEKKGHSELNQLVSSFLEFQVQIEGFGAHPIRYTFDAPHMIHASISECERKLQEEANFKRQRSVSELEKYRLACRDIVSFDEIPKEHFEEFLRDRQIRVGPGYGSYIPNSFNYQLAKILKPSDHQAAVRRKPGKITTQAMEKYARSVDAQRAVYQTITLLSVAMNPQGDYPPQVPPPNTYPQGGGGAFYPNGRDPYYAMNYGNAVYPNTAPCGGVTYPNGRDPYNPMNYGNAVYPNTASCGGVTYPNGRDPFNNSMNYGAVFPNGSLPFRAGNPSYTGPTFVR